MDESAKAQKKKKQMEAIVGFGPGIELGINRAGNGRRRLLSSSMGRGKNRWSESRLKTKKVFLAELKWVGDSKRGTRRALYISTKPSDVNPEELLRLFAACNHSCHRLPLNGPPQAPLGDVRKLRLALSHSSFFVSVFAKSESLIPIPIPVRFDSRLVGFGRAVSDMGLTASIHDVMVLPSARRMGIGKMIVQRLVRMLTRRDIYDISALCSEEERLFFKECGFGDDVLASTTMMYTKTLSTCHEVDRNDQIVTQPSEVVDSSTT